MNKILALDPGGERMGWAVLEGVSDSSRTSPKWIDSGIWEFPRGDMKFQPYKLKLIDSTRRRVQTTFAWHDDITETVAEIVPAVGGGNFVVATQSYLANTAAATAQTVALSMACPIYQVGATTIKKQIGGKKDATKVRVRNGVYVFFPFLKESRGELWKKVFDESDAIAAGLTHLGYSIPT